MKAYNEDILACYLYVITRDGYPPDASRSTAHLHDYHRLGFRSVELEGIRETHLAAMVERSGELIDTARSLQMKVPVFCVVLPGLSAAEGAERERNLPLFLKGCEMARALGADAVLDNAPLPPWEFPEGVPVSRHYDEGVLADTSIHSSLCWESYWEGLVETYRHCCDIAAEHGLSYQLHPCYGALVQSSDAFLHFAEAVKRDNLRFNLDTANQYYMKDNLYLSLIRLKAHIDYIHISDNRGQQLEHLPLGEGNIHWDRFFDTLDRIGYAGRFGIDIGGAESDVPDLDRAYRGTAGWLEDHWFKFRS